MKSITRAFEQGTATFRPLPDFLIIGGIRCGTTSMIRYLGSHPRVGVPSAGEVHFFDWNYGRGEGWYRSWFPLKSSRATHVGESSPAYLMNPMVPERVAALMPNVKLLLLLREPVERAASHFSLRKAKGHEVEDSLAAALADESRRLEEKGRWSERGGRIDCYYTQGEYATGLSRWLEHFPRTQLHVIESGEMFTRPEETYQAALDFLELPPHDANFEVHNSARRIDVDPQTLDELRERYAPHNRRLFELVGRVFDW
jgi:hypothetical protein